MFVEFQKKFKYKHAVRIIAHSVESVAACEADVSKSIGFGSKEPLFGGCEIGTPMGTPTAVELMVSLSALFGP